MSITCVKHWRKSEKTFPECLSTWYLSETSLKYGKISDTKSTSLSCVSFQIQTLQIIVVMPCKFPLQIYKLSLKSQHCRDVHRLLPIECLCAFLEGEEGDKLRLVLSVLYMYIQYVIICSKCATGWNWIYWDSSTTNELERQVYGNMHSALIQHNIKEQQQFVCVISCIIFVCNALMNGGRLICSLYRWPWNMPRRSTMTLQQQYNLSSQMPSLIILQLIFFLM